MYLLCGFFSGKRIGHSGRMMFFALGLAVLSADPVQALDRIVTNAVPREEDKRENYPYLLLNEAMQRTKSGYGTYQIVSYGAVLQRQRALKEMERGAIDVYSAATQPAWEERLLPVRIPLRKGILGYRLFLIQEGRQPDFSRITSLDELRGMRLGSGSQWSITRVFHALDFNVVNVASYEALFRSLTLGRYDFFPRGVNEIFTEYEDRHAALPVMAVEQELALYLPLPTYFFVTPLRPGLEKRLSEGLEMMVADGSFDRIFREFHGDHLDKARLASRRIFRMDNPDLSPQTPLDRQELWHQP